MSLQEMLDGSVAALRDVHPFLRTQVNAIITDLAAEGLFFAAFQGYRSYNEQAALFAQGREPLYKVNARRILARLKPISATENQNVVTKARAGQSWHNFAAAVDLVEDGDPLKTGIQWSWKSIKSYLKIGPLAKKYGLDWGGFWRSWKDYPHLEYTHGLTLLQANAAYRAGGVPEVWRCVEQLT